MQNYPEGNKLLHEARQTDMAKLMFAFIAKMLRTRQKTAKPTWAVTAPSDRYPQTGPHVYGFGNLPGVHKGVSVVETVSIICE